jgi:large subunit ribosomal protein L33
MSVAGLLLRTIVNQGEVTIMARHADLRPIIKLRSTAGTGYTYVTRKSRRNDPDRMGLRKYDPIAQRHVEFREER